MGDTNSIADMSIVLDRLVCNAISINTSEAQVISMCIIGLIYSQQQQQQQQQQQDYEGGMVLLTVRKR